MKFFQGLIILAVLAFLWACGHFLMPQDWGHHTVAPGTLAFQGTDIKGYQQFVFADSSATPQISKNNDEFLNKVAAYMKANPDHKLTLTGRFMPGEEPTGIYENLGLERAAAVRVLLVKRGIDDDRIAIRSELVQRGDFSEPVSFLANKPAVAASDKKPVNKGKSPKFTFKNMTYSDANFDVNSAIFNPGRGFRNYADSVKIYMTKNVKSNLTVIGHTDSDGTFELNQDLGMRRAQAVRTYFQNLGVKSSIATKSKGETEPVASNDTADNKRKNRRVVVQIND